MDLSNGIETKNVRQLWSFDFDELYRITLKFFKDNDNKAFHPTYDERNYLLALIQQINNGPFNSEKAVPLGALDIIGRDRRLSWASLNTMDKVKAKENFIDKIDSLCKAFKPYIEAHERERSEIELKMKLEENLRIEKERKKKEEEEEKILNEEKAKQIDAQKVAIREALNQQTFNQFKAYAEQQYPGDDQQQQLLIEKLQEQHFQQYMAQIVQNQLLSQTVERKTNDEKTIDSTVNDSPNKSTPEEEKSEKNAEEINCNNNELNQGNCGFNQDQIETKNEEKENEEEEEEKKEVNTDEETEEESSIEIEKASVWRTADIETFKHSIRKENSSAVININHGEVFTVNVPTHVDGNRICWEFATDNHDIAFGLFFEWTENPGQGVSVQITEDTDDDDEDEQEDDEELLTQEIQQKTSGGGDAPTTTTNDQETAVKTKTNEKNHSNFIILPIQRVPCHEQVHAGSHTYPGRGIYMLKFDNSYALWRTKTLYYRVFYNSK